MPHPDLSVLDDIGNALGRLPVPKGWTFACPPFSGKNSFHAFVDLFWIRPDEAIGPSFDRDGAFRVPAKREAGNMKNRCLFLDAP